MASSIVACPECGVPNGSDQSFCSSCGTSLTHPCPNCALRSPISFQFCGNCGARFEAEPLPEAAPGPAARGPSEERRLATILFADVAGFTNLSERMDPEDVRSLVDTCMAKLGEIVARFGGRVDNVIGDALMAEFGAQVAHGDDPERAVRAALEMQRCATVNTDEFGGLALRVGVNTGEVMFAPIGPEARRHFTVIGDAVNTAQRLQSASPPGAILVGEETYRATRKAIRFERGDPPEITVKGKERPLLVWRPLGALTTRASSTIGLVGREAELGLLRRIWERTAGERRPRLVTILGHPGIGKSRLAEELATLVEAQGGQTLWGRSLPYGETTGFGAFSQQVKQLAGIFENDAPAEAKEKLAAAVRRVLPGDPGDAADHLALLLGLQAMGNVPDKAALFFSCRRLIEAAAAERPTLLGFEDVQWAEGTLLELLEMFAVRVKGVPLLVVALARPELFEARPNFAAAVPSDVHMRLPLEPLTTDESRTLAVRLLAQVAGPVGLDLAERLASTAEGNPLFIEELAASLVERATGAGGELPTTVKGIIAARLDALPKEERAVVLDASVVGKQFWRGALERLAGDGAGLDEILDSLELRDLVRRQSASTVEGDEEFIFKNMLIREVAYATLPKAARRERHAQVARFIEDSAGERADENAAVLAHHWREAGETARAVAYLLRAAERAGRAWAKGEAVSLYEQALELMPEDDPSRRKARLERAIGLFDSTDYKTAIPELEALIPELEGKELFTGLFTRAMTAYWSADSENARLFGRRAVGLAEQLGNDEVSALALGLLSPVEAMEGDVPKAIEVGERALARWRPGSYPGRLGVLRAWMGIERYWLGQYEEAVADGRTGFELGLANHNIEATLTGGSHHGLALAGLGRHEEALETFARVAALGRELELQPRFTARLTNTWAGTLRDLYDLEPARRLNEEAIELAGRAGFPPAGVSGRLDLLVTDLLEGEVGRAEQAWPELWERADAVKGFHQWLWRLRLMHAKAEIELAAGRAAGAAETAVDALSRAEQYGRLKYVAASRLTLGSALLELGRATEAADTFRLALAEADRLGHPPTIWGSAAKLGRALAAAGDDEAAETALARARDAVSAFAAGLSPARRELFLGSSHVFGIGAPAR